ncbi:LuxR C-terminal-related transcriptional regulator [Leucobacter sp. HY1908]
MEQHATSATDVLLNTAVQEFASVTGFPLAFGGFEHNGIATISAITGHRTGVLQGLQVAEGKGLGGRSLSESRPRLTYDYRRSQLITHDYDANVLPEGIQSLFAYPVMYHGRVRALLYGGSRTPGFPRDALAQGAAGVARELVQELRVADEIEQRLRLSTPHTIETPASLLEELRLSHAELRAITSSVHDRGLRAQLEAVVARLERAATPHKVATTPRVQLTPREVDVLCQAAVGASNAEVGFTLGLTESTVKSYMKTAMVKLDASTRHAAVTAARRMGLIL